jgi:exopolysaccharide biosynthesis polyprenyl glycosylphosphotransferase
VDAALRRLEKRARVRPIATGQKRKNVIIVGAGPVGQQLASCLEAQSSGRTVRGFLDQNRRIDPRVLGSVGELARVARSEFADEIIIAIPHQGELARTAIIEAMRNHLDVSVVPDLFGYAPCRTLAEQVGPFPLIPVNEERLPEVGLVLKRALDIVLASVALVLLAPLLLAVALTIKLDSSGPVFYRAVRAGKKGRQFLCWKFRTMAINSDQMKADLRERNEREGPTFKVTDDPRITRAGRLLRRYSLDELPQLWNVLKGEMSLVGPRPHPLDDYQRYELEHLRRLDVTPGITGLWQIKARRDPSFNTNMALDLDYIDHWSLWLDVCILLKTVKVLLAGTGV